MINELFLEILDAYLLQKKSPFKENSLASLLRHSLPKAIREKSCLTDQYKIKGSPGSGNWAEVPWVAVLDQDITDTPEREFYIVYLFDAEMKGVYLSLNQGWVQYEKKFGNNQPLARKAIIKKTKELQSVLESSYDFPKSPIDLHAKNNLGRGYELGHICGKFYPKNSLPDDIHFIDDLRNLVGVYRELKGKAGRHILDFEVDSDEIFDVPLTRNVEIHELVLDVIAPRKKINKPTEKPILFDLEKTLMSQKRHKKIGDSAENLVVEVERDRLKKANRADLAAKVSIVSQDMAKGYDILSYEVNGDERQIEVKGSTSNDLNAFFLSANEREKSKLLNNYYLFVVHGVGTENQTVQFIQNPDFDSELFSLEPRQYLVRYCTHKG